MVEFESDNIANSLILFTMGKILLVQQMVLCSAKVPCLMPFFLQTRQHVWNYIMFTFNVFGRKFYIKFYCKDYHFSQHVHEYCAL